MIGIERDGAVAIIELQRDEARNALNDEMVEKLQDAITTCAAESRVIVLCGQGKVFSAGADLNQVFSEKFLERLLELNHTIDSVPVPVIAAIHGAALGGGVQLALASDLRVVAPGTVFGIPAAKIGVTVDRWTIHRLMQLIGAGPARTMLLGLEPIFTDDAYRLGFANKIGTREDAIAWAHKIAELAPLSLAHMKMALNDDGTQDPEPAEQRAALLRAWTSEDAQEGRRARAEKRTPQFTGQ